MTEKTENDLTFEQFTKMCEDAGISAAPEEMEQDFRIGQVIADVVDEVMAATEAHPPFADYDEGYAAIKAKVEELGLDELDSAGYRAAAVELAALALRFAADLCHDEAGNN